MTLPSKEVLLERERRWLRPAGILAIAGALIYATGQVIPQIGLDAADTDAERLGQFHDHAGKFLLGQTLQGVGFAFFAAPLFILVQAAAGRTERVRRGLVPFAFIGPILIAISSVVLGVGFNEAADSFVEKAPAASLNPTPRTTRGDRDQDPADERESIGPRRDPFAATLWRSLNEVKSGAP